MNNPLDTRLDQVLAAVLGLDNVPHQLRAEDVEAWDSANHIRIVLALEEVYGVTFSIPEIEAATSRAALRALLSAKGVLALPRNAPKRGTEMIERRTTDD